MSDQSDRGPLTLLRAALFGLALMSMAVFGIAPQAVAQTTGTESTPIDGPFTRDEIDAARAAFTAGDYSVIESVAIPAAQAGDASAQNLLAIAYQFGFGVPQSASRSRELYILAAEQGLGRAQANLSSRLISDPKATDADYAMALRFALAATDQGFLDAYTTVTLIYQNGLGVPADFEQAVAYARLGADAGDATSTYYLASFLYRGDVQTLGDDAVVDHAQARALFAIAAELGEADAAFYVGQMAALGEGGPMDLDAALAGYTEALAGGTGEAPYSAAMLIRDNPEHFKDALTGLSLCYLSLRTVSDAQLEPAMLDCADWANDFSAEDNAAARTFAANFDFEGIIVPRPVVLDPSD